MPPLGFARREPQPIRSPTVGALWPPVWPDRALLGTPHVARHKTDPTHDRRDRGREIRKPLRIHPINRGPERSSLLLPQLFTSPTTVTSASPSPRPELNHRRSRWSPELFASTIGSRHSRSPPASLPPVSSSLRSDELLYRDDVSRSVVQLRTRGGAAGGEHEPRGVDEDAFHTLAFARTRPHSYLARAYFSSIKFRFTRVR